MGAYDYPDTLGYITNDVRANFNGVQMALAVNPRTVRTGRTFHAVLVAQNNTSSVVELNAALSLPGSILRRKTGQFAASSEPQEVRLRPGETGYLLMPVVCQSNAALSDNYKLGVSITVRPLAQSRPLRPESGGSPPDMARLTEKRRAALERMRQIEYSAAKRFGREGLVAPFRVVQGMKPQTEAPQKGGWFSLWNLAEDATSALLLTHYSELIRHEVFPKLDKAPMFEPLRKITEARFRSAGYSLKPLEAIYIAKLLTLVVHMANPGEDTFDYLGSQAFNVSALFSRDLPDDARLPRWFEGLLRGIANDETAANNPAAFICARLYETLVREVLPFAFDMIRNVTGEDLGNEAEILEYTANFIRLLNTTGDMDFAHTYMPLVMGGIIVYDRVIVPDEMLEDTLRGMSEVLAMRDAEWSDDNDLVFLMAKEVVNRSLRLFGFQI